MRFSAVLKKRFWYSFSASDTNKYQERKSLLMQMGVPSGAIRIYFYHEVHSQHITQEEKEKIIGALGKQRPNMILIEDSIEGASVDFFNDIVQKSDEEIDHYLKEVRQTEEVFAEQLKERVLFMRELCRKRLAMGVFPYDSPAHGGVGAKNLIKLYELLAEVNQDGRSSISVALDLAFTLVSTIMISEISDYRNQTMRQIVRMAVTNLRQAEHYSGGILVMTGGAHATVLLDQLRGEAGIEVSSLGTTAAYETARFKITISEKLRESFREGHKELYDELHGILFGDRAIPVEEIVPYVKKVGAALRNYNPIAFDLAVYSAVQACLSLMLDGNFDTETSNRVFLRLSRAALRAMGEPSNLSMKQAEKVIFELGMKLQEVKSKGKINERGIIEIFDKALGSILLSGKENFPARANPGKIKRCAGGEI